MASGKYYIFERPLSKLSENLKIVKVGSTKFSYGIHEITMYKDFTSEAKVSKITVTSI